VKKIIVGFCDLEMALRNGTKQTSFSRVYILQQTAALKSDICIVRELDAFTNYKSYLICAYRS
jgi:hypothetical protein